MTSPRLTGPSETTLTQDLLYAGRYYLGGRRGLLILAAVAIVAGLALNWSWLVAVGIAPILLGVLPCLAMCALGRSEEHTSELQSLMRISYAVFCLKKKKQNAKSTQK